MSWPRVPLDDVVALQRGFDLPSPARRPGPFPVVSAGGIVGTHADGPVKGPGVAIGRATNLGRPTWVAGDYWPLNTTLYVKDFKGNDPGFVYRLFQSLDLTGFDSGSVQAMLNRNYIARLPVSLPPLAVQQAIAEVLGALDDKTAANRETDALASELAVRLFARASSAKGARERALWEAVEITFGEPFSGDRFSEPGTGRPLIRIRDLKTHSCQVWTTEERSSETIIRAGDVLAGMDAEFRPSYWLGEDGVLNQRCLTADSRLGGKAFALEVLKAPLARIERSKSATTVIHLNKADLLRETVIVPGEAELREFSATAEPLRLRRIAIARESFALASLRDTLLPHLMSGRITVREAEKAVEEVL